MFLLSLEKKTMFSAFVGKEDNVYSCRWTIFFAFIGERRQSFSLLLDYSDKGYPAMNFYSLCFTCKVLANFSQQVGGMKVLNTAKRHWLHHLFSLQNYSAP
jgi:hypothetical protein